MCVACTCASACTHACTRTRTRVFVRAETQSRQAGMYAQLHTHARSKTGMGMKTSAPSGSRAGGRRSHEGKARVGPLRRRGSPFLRAFFDGGETPSSACTASCPLMVLSHPGPGPAVQCRPGPAPSSAPLSKSKASAGATWAFSRSKGEPKFSQLEPAKCKRPAESAGASAVVPGTRELGPSLLCHAVSCWGCALLTPGHASAGCVSPMAWLVGPSSCSRARRLPACCFASPVAVPCLPAMP